MSQYEATHYGSGGGGGYVQGSGSPFSPFSQGGSPSGRRGEVSHSLRPLTISQLSKASQTHTEAEWKLDDLEVGQFTLVGQVVSSQKQTTNHVYVIDDGTGRMEGRKWIADATDEDESNDKDNFDQKYVRVFGGLKNFGKKRYLNINHIRLVSDPHEVYFHILEAITVSLIVERGPPTPLNAGQTKLEGAPSTTSAYSAQGNAAAIKSEYAHLPDLQRRILEFIRSKSDLAEGVHVSEIARTVAGPNDANQISLALENLMEVGAVYTTVDDSHFLLT